MTLQERVEGFDAAGQPTEEWVDLSPTWASVEPLRGRQLFSAREAGMEATHQVTLPWHPGLRNGSTWKIDRIVHDGRHLYPEGPPMDTDERRREVEVMVTERTDPEGP